MSGYDALDILQYNAQKSNDVVMAELFSGDEELRYTAIAVQEPWINSYDPEYNNTPPV